MKQYLELINHVMENGAEKGDRTGTGIKSVFGYQMRFNLQEGFPLLTTKKVHFPSVAHELLWFLTGSTNIAYLKEHKVRIWDEWALKENTYSSTYKGYIEAGDIGPMYGKQWTDWESPNGDTINQIEEVINTIKTNPNSRRMLVTAWNPADLPDESMSPQENVAKGRMALAACHAFFQFYVVDGKLSCQIYQRSADVFLGVPFNIASYALLTHMVAQQCDLEVGELIWVGGDTHIYSNHYAQVTEQSSREPYSLPQLKINRKPDTIFDYKFEDFEIENYVHHEHIAGKVAV